MAEEAKTEGSCGTKRCCAGKALVGGLVGLLLAGAGFGLYSAGKCAGAKGCPYSAPAK